MEEFHRLSRLRKTWSLSKFGWRDLAVAILGAIITFVASALASGSVREAARAGWIALIGAAGAVILYHLAEFAGNFARAGRLIAEEAAAYYRQQCVDLDRRLEATLALKKQKLAIEFDRKGSCIHYYPSQWNGKDGTVTLYRVRIRNLSVEQIDDVEVKLVQTDPGLFDFLPLRLHQMHDNPFGSSYQKSFSLSPDNEQYIDVVQKHSFQESSCTLVQTDVTSSRPFIDLRWAVKLTIAASGRGIPKTTEDFAVYMNDETFKLELWESYDERILKPQRDIASLAVKVVHELSESSPSPPISSTPTDTEPA